MVDQFTLDGYISWQPTGAPLEVVNLVDSIYYTSVETYEFTSSSPSGSVSLYPFSGGGGPAPVITAIYMEVYDKTIIISAGYYSGSPSTASFPVSGASAGSLGGGGPDQNLVGRFFYTFPTDDSDDYGSGNLSSVSASPTTGATGKVWVFFR
jgi:hypothetical protein